MKCPECKATLRVVDTRSIHTVVIRTRKCPNCDKKFRTTERILKDESEETERVSGGGHSSFN